MPGPITSATSPPSPAPSTTPRPASVDENSPANPSITVTLPAALVERALRDRVALERDLERPPIDLGPGYEGHRLVRMRRIEPHGLYDAMGLVAGDVLMRIDDQQIFDDGAAVFDALRDRRRVTLRILRRGIVQVFEYRHDWREIWLDGRALPTGDDLYPLDQPLGYSPAPEFAGYQQARQPGTQVGMGRHGNRRECGGAAEFTVTQRNKRVWEPVTPAPRVQIVDGYPRSARAVPRGPRVFEPRSEFRQVFRVRRQRRDIDEVRHSPSAGSSCSRRGARALSATPVRAHCGIPRRRNRIASISGAYRFCRDSALW